MWASSAVNPDQRLGKTLVRRLAVYCVASSLAVGRTAGMGPTSVGHRLYAAESGFKGRSSRSDAAVEVSLTLPDNLAGKAGFLRFLSISVYFRYKYISLHGMLHQYTG